MSVPTALPATLEAAQAVIVQKQAELDRLHAMHEAWMRAVAHDLRAPLRHVVSFAPLLKEAVEELSDAAPQAIEAVADAREFAVTMEHAARKMSAMLDGLATISRAARAPLHWEALDWTALVSSLVEPLRAQFPSVQWTLPTQPVWVMADADGLRRIMQALLDNAVKFSAYEAQPHVSLAARPQDSAGWQLQVQDNGVGFDDQRAQHLGDLFQRMHRDNEFDGVGCGLALVQTIAQRHGASWRVQSQPKMGCTVFLNWPVVM